MGCQTKLPDDKLLNFLVDGWHIKEIRHEVGLSKSQLGRRMTQIYKKYNVKSRDRVSLLIASGRLVKGKELK